MKPITIIAGFLSLCLFLLSCEEDEQLTAPQLRFSLGEKLQLITTSEELALVLQAKEIQLEDVYYHRQKQYLAFRFADVLAHVFGEDYEEKAWNAVSFHAIDGYNAVVNLAAFQEPTAFLVFADLETEGWEPIPGHGAETPAPFYLVWTEAHQTYQNGFPWPWAIASIELVRMEDAFSSVLPDKEEVSEETYQGYQLFMSRCNNCHSVGEKGGQIGPNLNQPQNILSYRSEEMVRAFITESSRFRISRMPDFKDLSPRQVDQLIAYLRYLKDQKTTASPHK